MEFSGFSTNFDDTSQLFLGHVFYNIQEIADIKDRHPVYTPITPHLPHGGQKGTTCY